MARLMLSLDGQILAEYNMNKERYTIGRLPDNDIRIDNPAVSGHHSLIINILNDSFLEDLNSTNGTYVNGKLIKKHAMQHGDVITVAITSCASWIARTRMRSRTNLKRPWSLRPAHRARTVYAASALRWIKPPKPLPPSGPVCRRMRPRCPRRNCRCS